MTYSIDQKFTVPFSELAMHCKIAGKRILAFQINEGARSALVWTSPDKFKSPVCGLLSEVLPIELRGEPQGEFFPLTADFSEGVDRE